MQDPNYQAKSAGLKSEPVSFHAGEEVELKGARLAVMSVGPSMMLLRKLPGNHIGRDEGARADLFIPVSENGTVHVRLAAADPAKAVENWRTERGDLEGMTVRRWMAVMK